MAGILDLLSNLVALLAVKAQAVAATLTGTGVDCADIEGPLLMVANVGVCTDGGYTITLEESDALASGYTAVALSSAMPEIITSNDDQIYMRRFKRSKRYVRAVITESSAGTTGVVISITIHGVKKSF